jgi:hypothetical protein
MAELTSQVQEVTESGDRPVPCGVQYMKTVGCAGFEGKDVMPDMLSVILKVAPPGFDRSPKKKILHYGRELSPLQDVKKGEVLSSCTYYW